LFFQRFSWFWGWKHRFRLQRRRRNPTSLYRADDIGYWNVSANNHGMMGYRTPNIDRIAKEGANFNRPVRAAVLHSGTRRVH